MKEIQLQLLGRSPGTLPPRTGTRTDSPTPASPGATTDSGRSWDSRSGCGVGAGGGALRNQAARPTASPLLFPTSGPDGASGRMCRRAEGRQAMRCPHMQLGKMCLPLESKNSESEWSKPGGLRRRVPGALQPHCKVQMATEHSRTEAP